MHYKEVMQNYSSSYQYKASLYANTSCTVTCGVHYAKSILTINMTSVKIKQMMQC